MAGLLGGSVAADGGPLRDWIAQRRMASERADDTADTTSDGGIRDARADDGEPRRANDSALPPGVRRLSDVPYGADVRQTMDVYLPPLDVGTRPAAIVLMVHGGAWRYGDKAAAAVVSNKVARWTTRGTILVSVNYRLLPQADPSLQADDVARALAAVQAHAAEWGGDPARVVLIGHSAGAHLVALLGADPARAYALGARAWRGVVALDSAALDLEEIMERRHLPLYDAAFGGDAAFWHRLSPYHRLTSAALPSLLVCSSLRVDQPCAQAARYARRAQALGVRAEVLAQPLSHAQINARLGEAGAYTEAVERFLQEATR